MSMTPEETANQYIWEVLKRIKQEIELEGSGEAIEYELSHAIGAGIPSKNDEMKIIRKLARDGAVKILEAHEPNWQGPRGWFKLEILQSKFGEVYEKYRKACDLTSYLNDYQERMIKGDSLPEFSQIEHIDNKEKVTPAAPIKHKGQMFETGSGGGYYNRSHPIRPMKKQSANEIVDGFSSSNYAFVLMVSEGILSASEFGSDGEVNYRLQSAPGQMLMQERQLLSKFEKLGLFRNLGEDGISGIVTLRDVDIKRIREIIDDITKRCSQPPINHVKDVIGPIAKALPNSQVVSVEWLDDFVWQGNTFVFGDYGNITFSSTDKKNLFKTLTDARGDWTTIENMEKETGKNGVSYIRSTIGQIEKRFKPKLRKHVSIPSTREDEDDVGTKPDQGKGAYRIKFTIEPQQPSTDKPL